MTAPAAGAASKHNGWRRALPVAISLLALALALRALSAEFSTHGYAAIRHAFHGISASQILLTLVLGLSSYACLVLFDAIGLHRKYSDDLAKRTFRYSILYLTLLFAALLLDHYLR